MSLTTLLSGIHEESGTLSAQVPPHWMQGRTAYGGASAALALTAAHHKMEEVSPLRSAQFAFLAPLAGQIALHPYPIRLGNNSAFVGTEITGDAGPGLTATFLFCSPRMSSVNHCTTVPPEVIMPEETEPRLRPPRPDFFADNFEYRPSAPKSAQDDASMSRWVRLREQADIHPELELMAIADALPPAVTPLMGKTKIASSINWTINILAPRPSTRDGWWLLRSETCYAREGFSSQTMHMWNRDLNLVATGIQSVSIYS